MPAAPALLSTDPVTQKVLASVLGSLDDRSNRWAEKEVQTLLALAAGIKGVCEVRVAVGRSEILHKVAVTVRGPRRHVC